MKTNTIDATLYCVTCDEDTVHHVMYKGDQVYRITCTKCGTTIQMDQEYINHHYKEDFVRRVLTKPARMSIEMQKDLDGFLRSLPFRVITKPFRVAREINEEIVDEIGDDFEAEHQKNKRGDSKDDQ